MFIFLLILRLWHIKISGQWLNWDVKKALIKNILLLNPIKGVTLANADIFLLAFLHESDIGSLNFKFTSIFTLNIFHIYLLCSLQF